VLHYKGKRWFMINAAKENATIACTASINAVGFKERDGYEGTCMMPKTGSSRQSGGPGQRRFGHRAASEVPPGGQAVGYYWIVAAWTSKP